MNETQNLQDLQARDRLSYAGGPLPATEAAKFLASLQAVEATHDVGTLPGITPAHGFRHDVMGPAIDENYYDRTPADQQLVGAAAELGVAAEHSVGIDKPEAGSFEKTLDAATERANRRADAALEQSEYTTSPELEQAIGGYYRDHYRAAAIVKRVIAGPVSAEEASQLSLGPPLAENFTINASMDQLLLDAQDPAHREQVLKKVDSITRDGLFNERSVGLSTVGTDETAVVSDLLADLARQHELRGEPHDSPGRMLEDWQQGISISKELVQQDSRHAGQLLFHNSNNFYALAQSGYQIKTRSRQIRENGSYISQNKDNGGRMNSDVPHWSERFDPIGYKGEAEDAGGTLAVPLAEIIKTAPYARDAHYGTLQLKEPAVTAAVPVNDKLGSIGVGHEDVPGIDGTDRVFFAAHKSEDVAQAHDYAVTGLFQLFTEHDLQEDARHGRSLEYPHGPEDPVYVVVPGGARPAETAESETVNAIQRLQQFSRLQPQYAAKVIAPLRSGVIEFANESSGFFIGKGSGGFGNFQRHVEPAYVERKVRGQAHDAERLPTNPIAAARIETVRQAEDQLSRQATAERAVQQAADADRMAAEIRQTGESPEAWQERRMRELEASLGTF